MENEYKLRYLPRFENDLMEIVNYISHKLKNPAAAQKLVDDVEQTIIKRSYSPGSFEPYCSAYDRENNYYRIYVRNCVIYYVVLENIMEVRRIVYHRRNRKRLV